MVIINGNIDSELLICLLKDYVSTIILNDKVIYGNGYINIGVGKYNYVVYPKSFFQINTGMIEKLYDLIVKVTDFPEIYIGNRSLERLHAFICGFLEGNPSADDHCLDGFTEYVCARYNISVSRNWSTIIPFFCGSEQEAFQCFVRLFYEFNEQRDNA